MEKCIKCSWEGDKLYKKCRECYNFPVKKDSQTLKNCVVDFLTMHDKVASDDWKMTTENIMDYLMTVENLRKQVM